MKEQIDLHEDLKIKFVEGAREQKELYNKVLELKGSCMLAFWYPRFVQIGSQRGFIEN